jgi:hypothetical protein
MIRPPLLAERWLRRIVPVQLQTFLLGDLEERFHAIARSSPFRARLWYWRQALSAALLPLPGSVGVLTGASPAGMVSRGVSVRRAPNAMAAARARAFCRRVFSTSAMRPTRRARSAGRES